MHNKLIPSITLLAAAWLALPLASAEGLRPSGYFVQGAVGPDHVWSATAGVVWPWSWRSGLMGGELSGITEAYASHWNAKATGSSGRSGFTQVGVVPMVRWRPDAGRSPWFVEGGIGLSTMDRRFTTPTKRFTTSFNFVDVIGVGRSFGSDRSQEIGVRLQHVSNAGIRVPNPGQNLVQLRYASAF